MALASLGTCAATNEKFADATLNASLTAQINTGEAALVVIALDNIQTTDGETALVTSVKMSGAGGQSLTKVAEFTNGQTAAAAGATVSVWKLDEASQNYTVASHTIDVVLADATVTAKALTAWRFSKTAGTSLQVAGYTTRADDGADVGSMALSGLTSREYLWLIGMAAETSTATAPTLTNYTAMTVAVTAGGGAATNMGARGLFRILTATGETVDPTSGAGAVDHASIFAAIYEQAAAAPVLPRRRARMALARPSAPSLGSYC